MIVSAEELVAAFDALPEEERRRAGAEILRRVANYGEIPESAYDELGAELFRAYDAEEAADAKS